MKKKILTIPSLLLCLVMGLILLTACVDKPNNESQNNNSKNDNDKLASPQKVVMELDCSNYHEYLEIQPSIDSQTSTLKYNTYVVTYATGVLGRTQMKIVNALTPPTGQGVLKCQYLSSVYYIQTIINVNIKSTSTEYTFSEVYLRFKFPYSGIILIEPNDKGEGSRTLNFVEESDSPYKSYSLSTTVMSISGTVTYMKP